MSFQLCIPLYIYLSNIIETYYDYFEAVGVGTLDFVNETVFEQFVGGLTRVVEDVVDREFCKKNMLRT